MADKDRKIQTVPPSEKRTGSGGWLTTGTKTRNVSRPDKLYLLHRRREAMRLRQEEGLSFKEIRDRILEQRDRFWENPEEASYNTSLVSQDILVCLQSLGDETQELAKRYLPGELLKLEKREQKIEAGWEDVEEVRRRLMDRIQEEGLDIDETVKLAERMVNMLDKLDRSFDRVQNRRGVILPLQAPKRVEMDARYEKAPTLDEMLRLKKELDAEKKNGQEEEVGEVIEGEFTSD